MKSIIGPPRVMLSAALLGLAWVPGQSTVSAQSSSVAVSDRNTANTSGPPGRTSVVAHGLKLTLYLGTTVFRRNALVIVTPVVENISHRPRFIRGAVQQCGESNPLVIVSNGQGRDVYPPAFSRYFPAPCPMGSPIRILSGHIFVHSVYIIAAGRLLRAAVGTGASGRTELQTPPLKVKLTASPAPTFHLTSTPYGLRATLAPPPGAKGPLLYVSSAECGDDQTANAYADSLAWTTVRRDTITSGCTSTREWHAAAGWVNFPVARVDYTVSP